MQLTVSRPNVPKSNRRVSPFLEAIQFVLARSMVCGSSAGESCNLSSSTCISISTSPTNTVQASAYSTSSRARGSTNRLAGSTRRSRPRPRSRRKTRSQDLVKSFVARSKTMEIMEPRLSTFDYPSIFSEATAMLGAAVRKNGLQAPLPRPAMPRPATRLRTSCRVISTAVVLSFFGERTRRTADDLPEHAGRCLCVACLKGRTPPRQHLPYILILRDFRRQLLSRRAPPLQGYLLA